MIPMSGRVSAPCPRHRTGCGINWRTKRRRAGQSGPQGDRARPGRSGCDAVGTVPRFPDSSITVARDDDVRFATC